MKQILIRVTLWWFTTRILLCGVGLWSQNYFYNVDGKWRGQWNYSQNKILNLWGVWDSGWYLDIAKNGYSLELHSKLPQRTKPTQSNYNFFPLYPIFMIAGKLLLGDEFLAGIVLSNIFLLVAGVFLFKILEKEGGKTLGDLGIASLFIFPTSFILSGVFSEGLFLALLLTSWFYAKSNKWWIAGLLGYLMTLTRSIGIMTLPAFMFIYLEQRKFKLNKLDNQIFSLGLMALGTLTYMMFTFWKIGDAFAYVHIATTGWDGQFMNPVIVLLFHFASGSAELCLISALTLFVMGLLLVSFVWIGWDYWFLGLGLTLPVLFRGSISMTSFPRYMVVVMPLYLLMAKFAKGGKWQKNTLFAICVITELMFMVLWSNARLVV